MMRVEKLTATLFAASALMFSYSAFAEDDEGPCTEENPCEELVVTGTKPLPPRIENPLHIHSVNTTDPILPSVETDCIVAPNARGMTVDSDCDGSPDECGAGYSFQYVKPIGHMCMPDGDLPACPSWMDDVLVYGVVIGGITRMTLTDDSPLRKDLEKIPSKYTKWIKLGSWWTVVIDFTLMGYCHAKGG